MLYGKNKDTLSYSALHLWETSKEQYRKRYYERAPFIETPEILYGKKIAKLLEVHDPFVRKVPQYHQPEHKMDLIVGGVKMIGFIDSFCPLTNRIYEYKTGRPKPDGSPRWDAVEVARTDQLPMYSLFVKEKYGEVEDLCHLIWLPTSFKKQTVDFDGHTLEASGNDIEWNGEVFVFPRTIHEYERKAMREKIISLAKEINDDYESYTRALGALPAATEKVLA